MSFPKWIDIRGIKLQVHSWADIREAYDELYRDNPPVLELRLVPVVTIKVVGDDTVVKPNATTPEA